MNRTARSWAPGGGRSPPPSAATAAARVARTAAAVLLAGSILFAATLYAMALGGPLWLGAVTPIGGLGMIVGWIWLGVVALRTPVDR